MTVEKIDNRPAILPLVLWPGASPIYVPRDEVEDISALLKGERALVREPGEPDIRRVLDLGANVVSLRSGADSGGRRHGSIAWLPTSPQKTSVR